MRVRDVGQRARRAIGPKSAGPPRRKVAGLVFLRGSDADARLRSLEAQRVGARPLLGALAGRLVEGRFWRKLGSRNLADFARERLGVGARAVSEWARVWRALGELPCLREAVLAGEVSWTVARLVVRVATAQTDAACVETVRGRTVRAVEAMLKSLGAAAASTEPEEDEEERVAVRIPCPLLVEGKWKAGVELARLMAGEQLPVWACAEAMAAEAASALPLEPGRAEAIQPLAEESQACVPPRACVGPTGLEPGLRHVAFPGLPWWPVKPGLFSAHELELRRLGLELEECGARELERRLRTAVAFLQRLDLELGAVLRQVLDRRLYRELGFTSFEHYVRERLDTAPRTARRLVRLARAEHRAPQVADAFRLGRVSAFEAEVLLGVSEREVPFSREHAQTQARWLALAECTTLRRLQKKADALPRTAVAFHAPPEVAAFFWATLERVRRRMPEGAPTWAALEAMLDGVIHAWKEFGEQFHDYADFERDEFQCTMPGCTARSGLENHHIWFRSHHGPNVSWNRTTLCWFHHQPGVHRERTVRVWGRAPDHLVFELGVQSDGPPLARYRSGDILLRPGEIAM